MFRYVRVRVFLYSLIDNFMNRNILVATVGTIVLVAGGWWYFSQSGMSGVYQTPQLSVATDTETQPVANGQSTLTFNVYFGKEGDSSNAICSHSIVRTVAHTSSVAQAALVELFKGPTANEKQQGYYSCFFHTDISVKSLKIENGVATADFSKEYAEGCGGASTCSQEARNAVTNTLKQFPSIKSVRILIDGLPEGYDA